MLSVEEDSAQSRSVSLYVVKGNPLIVSSTPLPCFASGSESVAVDVRAAEDLAGVCLQVIVNDIGAHIAVPVDELLEIAASGSLERSLTMWDTQSGGMRGSALVEFRVESEEPHSYEEVMLNRKRNVWKNTSHAEVPNQLQSMPEKPFSNSLHANSPLCGLTPPTSGLVSSRAFDEELSEKESLKSSLVSESRRLSQAVSSGGDLAAMPVSQTPRRKRGILNHISFGENVATS